MPFEPKIESSCRAYNKPSGPQGPLAKKKWVQKGAYGVRPKKRQGDDEKVRTKYQN